MGFELILLALVLALGFVLLSAGPRHGRAFAVPVGLVGILILAGAWNAASYRRQAADRS